MFDLNKEQITFKCPRCGRTIKATLAQVSRQVTISCTGCCQSIALKDNTGSACKSIRDVNYAIKDFENSLKKFGR